MACAAQSRRLVVTVSVITFILFHLAGYRRHPKPKPIRRPHGPEGNKSSFLHDDMGGVVGWWRRESSA